MVATSFAFLSMFKRQSKGIITTELQLLLPAVPSRAEMSLLAFVLFLAFSPGRPLLGHPLCLLMALANLRTSRMVAWTSKLRIFLLRMTRRPSMMTVWTSAPLAA